MNFRIDVGFKNLGAAYPRVDKHADNKSFLLKSDLKLKITAKKEKVHHASRNLGILH